jgi:predicted transcriptional regulator of viral defense system
MAKIEQAKKIIDGFFDGMSQKAFGKYQLAEIFREMKAEWKLPKSFGFTKFLSLLLESGDLREVVLTSPKYGSETRFAWRSASVFAVALSLRRNSYLTHGSAVFVHGLNDQIPKTVYVNYEQSPKPRGSGLTQESIDRAFASTPRQSQLSYNYEQFDIVLINGKFTDRLEVSQVPGPGAHSEMLDVTKLERTLVDIVVRPVYAGGVFQVLEAFRRAKPLISVNTLVATLKKLDYVYPYHQVIGFYMEKAGYTEKQLSKLRQLPMSFDFYLTYQLPEAKQYDANWRLFYPPGL